jgi:thermostable 8-oxoguanine DNA glycosylase
MEMPMQEAWAGVGDYAERVVLPYSEAEVISGVRWGSADLVNTPAYWAVRCKWDEANLPDFVSKESPLIEEVGFCLLGGFGIKYEVNCAAFSRLKQSGVFDLRTKVSEEDIRSLLLDPLWVEQRLIKYRFPNQRARRLSQMRLKLFTYENHARTPLELRDKLLEIDGVGPKTASWIVRNHTGSDDVAIIDIHVIRACQEMRVFPSKFSLPRDYRVLEKRFLDFAQAIDVRPSVLDAVMWTEVRGGLTILPSG